MASKHLALEPPASQQQPGLKAKSGNKTEEDARKTLGEARPGAGEDAANPDELPVAFREVLRLIDKLTEEKPAPSKFKSLLTHPLLLTFVGFLLTGVVGGLLTYYYSSEQKNLEYQRSAQQKDLEHERSVLQQELARKLSFTDELNRMRVQKTGEVWEHIDQTEVILDGLLEKANRDPAAKRRDFDLIVSTMKDNSAVINKNRFWLGEQTYKQIKDYQDINGRYALDMLLGEEGIDLTETIRKRERAKQDILQIRDMFLKGEPESVK